MNELKDQTLFDNKDNLNEVASRFIDISKLCKEINDHRAISRYPKDFDSSQYYM